MLQRRQKAGEPLWFYKTVGSRFARAGVPDLIICYHGYFGAVELKGDSDPTPLQEKELAAVRAAHGFTHVARSVADVEDFLFRLRHPPAPVTNHREPPLAPIVHKQ